MSISLKATAPTTQGTKAAMFGGMSFTRKQVSWSEEQRIQFTKAAGDGNVKACQELWEKVSRHTPEELTIYLNGLQNAGKTQELVQKAQKLVFSQMDVKIGVTCAITNELMKRQLDLKDIEGLKATFAHMNAKEVQADKTTFQLMMRGYLQADNLPEALLLVALMEKRAIEIDVETYNLLIEAVIKSGDSKSAYALLEKIKAPNEKTFTLFLRMEAEKGNYTACDALWKKIQKPTSEQLKLYSKAYRVAARQQTEKKEKIALLKQAQVLLYHAKDSKVLLTSSHVNKVMKDLVKLDEYQAVEKTFAKMTAGGGLKADLKSYRYLLQSHFGAKEVGKAKALFLKLLSGSLKLDVTLFNVMIKGHAEANDLADATLLLQELKLKGIYPIAATYEPVIDGYTRDGRMQRAEELYREMRKEGLMPSETTHLNMIKGHRNNRDLPRAEDIFSKMKKDGQSLLVATNILVDALCEKREFRKAQNIFSQSGIQCETNIEGYYDLHGYSHSVAAFIAREKLTQTLTVREPVGFITGRGNHGHHKPFAMRDSIMEALQREFGKDINIEVDQINPGRIIVHPK